MPVTVSSDASENVTPHVDANVPVATAFMP